MTEEKKFYLTKNGLIKVEKELNNLRDLRLAKINGESPKVLHSEDLDQEYLSFQEDLNFMNSRLAELEYVLKNTEIIKKPVKSKQNIVDLGATVTLAQEDGSINEFTVVGSLEANPAVGKISNESPVGKFLLGHKINDEVVISSPIKVVYKVKKIKYSLS
jgi:transcription elongation factor GreA